MSEKVSLNELKDALTSPVVVSTATVGKKA